MQRATIAALVLASLCLVVTAAAAWQRLRYGAAADQGVLALCGWVVIGFHLITLLLLTVSMWWGGGSSEFKRIRTATFATALAPVFPIVFALLLTFFVLIFVFFGSLMGGGGGGGSGSTFILIHSGGNGSSDEMGGAFDMYDRMIRDSKWYHPVMAGVFVAVVAMLSVSLRYYDTIEADDDDDAA